jgi:integrase
MTETATTIDGRIAQANGRLKASKVGAAIARIGDRLAIRATFPPKPGSDKDHAYQQRIFLGYHANPTGIKLAEAEARKIGALLDCGDFEWGPYLQTKIAKPDVDLTVGEWVSRFEVDYFTRRARTTKSETTWKGDYWKVLKQLDQDAALDADLLRSSIASTKPDTKTRKRYCMVFGALAKLAGLDLDTKALAGTYSPKRVKSRDLPSDELVAEWFYKIENPEWQWVYGMLATYGLRPHEVFHLAFESMPILDVLDGKTGARKVWPCYPEWVEQFDLTVPKVPQVTGRNNSELGARVSPVFSKYGIPFVPYDLRHCWAVRTINFGLDISLAAQQMGHSAQVHTDLYHAWISERHHQRAYEAIMMRSDRPKAPSVSPVDLLAKD